MVSEQNESLIDSKALAYIQLNIKCSGIEKVRYFSSSTFKFSVELADEPFTLVVPPVSEMIKNFMIYEKNREAQFTALRNLIGNGAVDHFWVTECQSDNTIWNLISIVDQTFS